MTDIIKASEHPNNLSNDIVLSSEQKYAYDKFISGENLFITGPGGTGKTQLIQQFVKHLKQRNKTYQVCAMTGCASIILNCNARTIHSWSGIKIARGEKDDVIASVTRNRNYARTWKKTSVLILDEVSMLSKKIFEILEEIARHTKYTDAHFGGMQIIFCGDFCQLPPVGNNNEIDTHKFCFESPLWEKVFPLENCIELKKIFRQTDTQYINILNNIRKGVIYKKDIQCLNERVNLSFDTAHHNGCIPTKLFPLRSKADYINKIMYSKLDDEDISVKYIVNTKNSTYIENNKPIPVEVIVKCNKISRDAVENEINYLLSNSSCIYEIHLKIGAAVMCTVNLDMDNGICNGSQGIITDIVKKNNANIPIVRFANGIVKQMHPHFWQSEDFPTISIGQYPLCLAWALTIHKIQGATLQFAEIDIGKDIFECGQTYVALSRVQSLNGLYLSSFDPTKIQTNPIVNEYYKRISEANLQRKNRECSNLEKEDNQIKRVHI
jgi:ATP-dependent DNA helicase PIF1